MNKYWKFFGISALGLFVSACVSGRPLHVAANWDDGFVELWTKKADERGMTVGSLIHVRAPIRSDADLVAAVTAAETAVFGRCSNELNASDFRRIGNWYVVCISDGAGVCYFMTRLGETAVMYYAVGTIAS